VEDLFVSGFHSNQIVCLESFVGALKIISYSRNNSYEKKSEFDAKRFICFIYKLREKLSVIDF